LATSCLESWLQFWDWDRSDAWDWDWLDSWDCTVVTLLPQLTTTEGQVWMQVWLIVSRDSWT
jgi:hypothetical protein